MHSYFALLLFTIKNIKDQRSSYATKEAREKQLLKFERGLACLPTTKPNLYATSINNSQ